MAGYSKRSLAGKLGIKAVYSALLGTLPSGVSLHSRLQSSPRFIHHLAGRRNELAAEFPRLAQALEDDGTLWISWPEQGSGVKTRS